MRSIIFVLLTLSLLLALALGCSGTDGVPSTPEGEIDVHENNPFPPVHFSMEFDPDDWSVVVHESAAPREGLLDVTPWADIIIVDTEWVPTERNWYITAQLRNKTSHKGYGVWVVFTELGEKEVRNIDGFIYHGPEEKRVPFVALRKEAPFREFPGHHVESHTFVIHWPPGVNSWAPVEFYIDASWPNPRLRPMVEDLAQANFPPPCQGYAIRANVGDFQSPSSDLTVWADLSSYDQGDQVPMFDDGEHSDGEAGDGIFAAEFDPGSIFGTYIFTVYAEDPEGHPMENDLLFAPIEFPPLPPIQWETVVIGTQSGYHEPMFDVIKDEDSWLAFWDEHTSNVWPAPPAPEVDFSIHMVAIVMLGAKPNSCFTTVITYVNWSSENCGVMVYYDEVVPEPDCACMDVINYPFHFITVPQSGFEYGFKGTVVPLVCNCLEWEELASSTHCGIDYQGEWLITDQGDYEDFWNQLFGPGSEPPTVDFDNEMVLGFTQGTKPSSGYYIELIDICLNDAWELEIDYRRMIPGASCNVLWVITTPCLVVKAEKDLSTPVFLGQDEVYECD